MAICKRMNILNCIGSIFDNIYTYTITVNECRVNS